MSDYIRNYSGYDTARPSVETRVAGAFSVLMQKVYIWMTLAMVITGLAAYGVSQNEQLFMAIFSNRVLFFGLVIAELGLVIGLTAALRRISALVATLLFLAYSVLNGVTLASIFWVFSIPSITTAFLVSAGTFAVTAAVGYFTKRDLTSLGGILLMALIGLIIATVVNIFLKSVMMDYIVSGIGVLVFVGLTAYDSQKIKHMMLEYGTEVNDMTQKLAIIGALTLYLDFVNLFLYLLRFLGNRRD
jgi:FtsH-binding integral membrane protein